MNAEPDTLGELLGSVAARVPDRWFLVGEGRRIRYGEADREASRLASWLLAQGVVHGDRVALWMPNTPEWVLLALACARIGALIVPINTRYRAAEVEYIVRQSGARLVVGVDRLWSADCAAMLDTFLPPRRADGRVSAPSFPQLERVILLEADDLPGSLGRLAGAVAPEVLDAAREQVRADDPLVVVYTSGTTGWPKGAVHAHVMIRNCRNIAREMHVAEGDRILGHMPFYHIAGFCSALCLSVTTASTLVTLAWWKPDEAALLVRDEGVNIFGGIPTHFFDLVEALRRRPVDTSCLKSAWIGGATVTAELARAAREVLQLDALMAVYGMTETTSMTTLSRFEDPIEVACSNRGRVIGDFDVAVVDPETGAPRAIGADGEVQVRGHPVMLGYYEDPEATAKVMTADGWFRTGDVGRWDADGYLQITGRMKEIYIVGGTNVAPAEVERRLQSHPEIDMAVVVGVPDARLGEVGYAFVQLARGSRLGPDEVIAFARVGLADFKVPRHVEVVDAFPLTSTGKIQRFVMAERAAGRVR